MNRLPLSKCRFGCKHVHEFYSKQNISQNSVVDESLIVDIIGQIGKDKATGVDGLPVRFIIR